MHNNAGNKTGEELTGEDNDYGQNDTKNTRDERKD